MTNLFRIMNVLLFALLTMSHSAEAAEAPQANVAKAIIKATGFKGGLIVHLGCGDGQLTAALRVQNNVLVHGLDSNAANVKRARDYIHSLGNYGKVSVARRTSARLPYTKNLVNLIVAEDLGEVSMDEVMRVLTPRGVAYIKTSGKWIKTVKPVPENIGEWTHFLHGPDNNAVSKDRVVGSPSHIQWLAGPLWGRNHKAPTVSVVISAAGRIFTVVDEAPPLEGKPKQNSKKSVIPPNWTLVARDAFNGIILWKRPFKTWIAPGMGFKYCILRYQRRLVAIEDRVYFTLGLNSAMSVIDAVTGKTLQTYEGTERTDEIVVVDKVMIMLLQKVEPSVLRGSIKLAPDTIQAMDTETGKVIWQQSVTNPILGTLAVRDGRVFYSDDSGFKARDLKSGAEIWSTEKLVNKAKNQRTTPAVTVVASKNIILTANGNVLKGLSVDKGEVKWEVPCPAGYNNSSDVFVIGGRVWAAENGVRPGSTSFSVGRDPVTGKITKKISTKWAWARGEMGHHRCYRNKATQNFILVGQSGTCLINMETGKNYRNDWVRGTCSFGVLPCNGLLYAPPHACACYLEGKVNGFWALAAKRNDDATAKLPASGKRLERVLASEKSTKPKEDASSNPADWPTFRSNPSRGGAVTCNVPSTLKQTWKTKIGGTLSAPVCANGRVLVADTDGHSVHALDAIEGTKLWTYTTGGRVDSPPTISNGEAVFGSRDGWVYCVRVTDGQLLWRFRGAPEERQVHVRGQLESAWPISGSVLILDDTVYFVAGRSSFLDGGIFFYRLNFKTGEKISETCVYARDEKTDRQPTPIRLVPPTARTMHPTKVTLPDILSSDGKTVFMRHSMFSREGKILDGTGVHLFSSAGFLNKQWFHRTYWSYAENFGNSVGGWETPGETSPSGRIMVMDKTSIYGYGRATYREEIHSANVLFASAKKTDITKEGVMIHNGVVKKNKKMAKEGGYRIFRWANQIPFSVRALVLANKNLFAAGPVGAFLATLDVREGKTGSTLWVVQAADGKKLAEYPLDAPPVFDGMIAAQGKLFIALKDGSVVCLGEAPAK